MSEIANQQTHNDSARHNTKGADPQPETGNHSHNKPDRHNTRKSPRLEPISPLVAVKVPPSIDDEIHHSDPEDRRRVHPGEMAIAANALQRLYISATSNRAPAKGRARSSGIYHRQLDPVYQILHVRDHRLVPSGEVCFLSVSDGVAMQDAGHGVALDYVEGFP